ncbi:MAG TPA: DNA polymerase domain-containing protein [bacterium]|nr:DNA polymerase domain-containing protein [bacterium]
MRGWLFDVYPSGEGMTLWFLDEDGHPHPLRTEYHPAFYAAGPAAAVERLSRDLTRRRIAADLTPVVRQELFSGAELPVMRVAVHRPLLFPTAVGCAAAIPALTLYTCDLSAAQLFLYESGFFPLGRYEVAAADGVLREATPLTHPEDMEYEPPPLLVMRMRLDGDPVNPNHGWRGELEVAVPGEHVVLSGEYPEDLCRSLNRLLARYDPDVLLTDWGDPFLIPRLLRLSALAGVPLAFNRDPRAGIGVRRGRSYVTYGKTVYQAGAHILAGRWHLDLRNSFIYTESEMAGLLEIARLARLPVQRLARTSTGTAISSMQLARAVQTGILVPWHKSEPEGFKTAAELLITDKGGLTYQPLVGVYEGVGELDFSSMYPTIMARFNVSPETINCSCCAIAEPVPEIGHAICQRRRGLVPQVLDHLLVRREYYKRRKRETEGAPRAVYDQRQTALKWCLVTCLTGETLVLHRRDGRWKVAPIGEIVDSYLPGEQWGTQAVTELTVGGIDSELRVCAKPVKLVMKALAPAKMLRVKMRWGRELLVTPNHRCYVLHGGRLRVVRADELHVGDWVPLVGSLEGLLGQLDSKIDVIRALQQSLSAEDQDRWRVFGRPVQRVVRERYREFAARARDKYAAKTIWNWREYGYLPLSFVQPEDFRIEERPEIRLGRGKLSGGVIRQTPSVVDVDEDLGFLLGFFVGDGSATGTMIRFDVGANEREHLPRLRHILLRKFRINARVYRERRARMYVLQANSVALVEVFKHACGVAGSARTGKLRIPDVILNGPRDAQRGFVLGLIASDGNVSRVRDFVSIASASRSFIKELGFLFSLLGVDYRLGFHGRLHSIQTRNMGETRKILYEGAPVSRKHLRALRYRESVTPVPRLPQIPVHPSGIYEFSRAVRVTRAPRVSSLEMISQATAHVKLNQVVQRSGRLGEELRGRLPDFRRLLESPMIFAPVISIEETLSPGQFVYCFQLKDEPHAFVVEGNVLTSNSFGYLGYRNARYGRIEAHESTTAYSREMLLRAKEVAEAQGYRMLHAIVDSMWLQKPGADHHAYETLARDIKRVTNLPVAVEGVYGWVSFLPSKTHPGVGVPNRYLGVFQDGETKVRGIEVRRSDTPVLIEEMQARMLQEMFAAPTIEALIVRLPRILAVLEETLVRLREGSVRPGELALTTTISQEVSEYRSNHPVAVAARALAAAGIHLHPGEAIQYVITDADAKLVDERVRPLALLGADWVYDLERYAELLLRAAETVLEPFGYTADRLREEVWRPLSERNGGAMSGR